MRPGKGFFTFTNDGSEPQAADAGDEVVVTEQTAASLVRDRMAEVVEIIDPPSREDS
jgi:hypothetical protein